MSEWVRPGTPIVPRTNHSIDPELVNDDHPSGKIWSVYLTEAEKEDKALVEAWKGDMEGLLIFVSRSHSLEAYPKI